MGILSNFRISRVTNFLENKLSIVFRKGSERVGWYILDGKKLVRISIPKIHGGGACLSPGLTKKVMNNLKVSVDEFIALYECPMTGTHYEQKMRELVKLGLL